MPIVTILSIGVSVAISIFTADPPIQPTPEDFLKEIHKNGMDYDGKWIEKGLYHGFHLKPKDDCRTWDELSAVEIPAKSVHHVIMVQCFPSSTPGAGAMTFGNYMLIGDPQEIERIMDTLNHR